MTIEKQDTQSEQKKLESNDAQSSSAILPKKFETNSAGVISLSQLQDQMNFAQKLLKEHMISSSFKNEQQVVVAIQYALSLKIDPIVALNMMYVINGKPALYGDGPKVLCSRNSMIEYFREYFIDEEGKEITSPKKGQIYFGAVTEVKRRGEDGIQKDWFTLEDIEKAGLDRNPVYSKYKRTMMRYRARTQALKSKFADMLQGAYVAEYDFNQMVQGDVAEDRTPKDTSAADDINSILKD